MILYMEEGDIKEIGSHEELMEKTANTPCSIKSQFA